MLHRPGMWPWGTDDGDADAMATGRLYPDLCGFIYFIFHLHAPRASVDVPARPAFCSPLRGGSAFKPNSVLSEQSASKRRPRQMLNKLLDF